MLDPLTMAGSTIYLPGRIYLQKLTKKILILVFLLYIDKYANRLQKFGLACRYIRWWRYEAKQENTVGQGKG